MRDVVDKQAYRLGFFAGRATPLKEVDELIDLLVPVVSPFPLIRLGGPHDGGYLVPDDLTGIQMLFSPGVAGTWSFEQQLLDQYGITPRLCDRLPPGHGCPLPIDDVWIGPNSGDGVLSLLDWVGASAPPEGDLMLQMDIEGAEFVTLLAAPKRLLERFRVIVVEFHDLHRIADLHTSRNIIGPTLTRLHESFLPVHIHPNNRCAVDGRSGRDIPRVMEVTYLRRDRLAYSRPVAHLPHELDTPNAPEFTDIVLSDRWLGPRGSTR